MPGSFETVCSVLSLFVTLGLLYVDYYEVEQLSYVNSSINSLNKLQVSCSYACGSDYVQHLSRCCLYSNYNSCSDLSSCAQSKLKDCQSQRDSIIGKIWILSILALMTGAMFCIFRRSNCCKRTQQADPHRTRLYESLHGNINRSVVDDRRQRRARTAYKSFTHSDDQTSCSICLQPFHNDKAIKLKCGHIFHSPCIRSWISQHQNCPVCRSIQ